MSGSAARPSSIERRLMEEPRRTAGVDGSGEPVRLGERDSGGHVVGYIDEQGLAWESLRERILAVSGTRLAEALALPYDDARRDELMDEALEPSPTSCSSRSPEKPPVTSGCLSLGASSGSSSGQAAEQEGWKTPA